MEDTESMDYRGKYKERSIPRGILREDISILRKENDDLKRKIRENDINNIISLVNKYDFYPKLSDEEKYWIELYNNYIIEIFTPHVVNRSNIYLSGSSIISYLMNLPLGAFRDIDIVYFSTTEYITMLSEGREVLSISSTRYIAGMIDKGIREILRTKYILSKITSNQIEIIYKSLLKIYEHIVKDIDNKYLKDKFIFNKTANIEYDISTVSLDANTKSSYDNRITPIFGSKSTLMRINSEEIFFTNNFRDYLVNGIQKIVDPTLINILIMLKGYKIFNISGVYRIGGEYLPLCHSNKFIESDVIKEIKRLITKQERSGIEIIIPKYMLKQLFMIGDPIIYNCGYTLSFYICGELLLMNEPNDEFNYVYENESVNVLNNFKNLFGDNPIKNILNKTHVCMCPICQENIELSSAIIITRCNHYLHLRCYIEQILPYINYMISIYDNDRRKDVILPSSNQCPCCRCVQFNIKWDTLRQEQKIFNTRQYVVNGENKRYLTLSKNKGKDFNPLFIENLSIFTKYKTLEDYLVYKWGLIEKMHIIENIEINDDLLGDVISVL